MQALEVLKSWKLLKWGIGMRLGQGVEEKEGLNLMPTQIYSKIIVVRLHVV